MPRFAIDSTTINYFDPLGLECDFFTLRSVFHGATVEIDERGIKAAAATVAESWDTESPEGEFLLIDRPFLFFAYDRETNFVLYSGRYAGPGL